MRKSVTLECSAINVNKSITRLDYQWQKEFVDISGASKNTYETLEPGSYRCKITNGYRTVYTQDAIVALEPIWVTDIIINTQSITNSGKIQYTINPEEADDKTITFDTKITPDYTIDAAGNVTINADGCNFEVVARSQFGKDYSEVIGRKTITGYNRVAVKSITITTTTIQDTGQIQTSVSPENASITKKEFELLSGSEYVVMDNTGYVSEVKSPGTFSVRVSGFDKSGNVVINTKSIAATNEFVKITGVSITTDTVSEGSTITYKTIPTSVPANLKSVKIELYNQGNSDYVNVNIDSNGKVTGITEDMNGKKFKAKITVVDKYDNAVSNTKEITCKFIVVNVWIEPDTITNTGYLTAFYEPIDSIILTDTGVKVITNANYVNVDGDKKLPQLSYIKSGNGVIGVSKVDVVESGVITCSGGVSMFVHDKGRLLKSYTNTITLKKTPVTIPVTSITVPSQTITDEGVVNYTISPSNATNKNVKFSFKSSTSNATIDPSTGKITVTNDDSVVVVVTAQDGSGVKGEGTITLKKTPVTPTGDYFIAKTARGNKTGRGSWDNATDDINTDEFIYDNGTIKLGNTYIETDKVCDVGRRIIIITNNVSIIGGCEVGTFAPKSDIDKSGFYNISSDDHDGISINFVSAIITNCDFYNISSGYRNGVNILASSAIITNCDFYNISSSNNDDGSNGVEFFGSASATITNCNFYNINGNSDGIDFGRASATITNCNFYNISSNNHAGINFGRAFTTIENCTFSAIESNNSTRYTSYSDLIKILPPETGCKFLPEGEAQSIYFSNDCVINGKKVGDLLNTPTNPTITITPDSLTDSGTIAYTITPETSCQFAIIDGTFDAVAIGTAGDVNVDGNIMWFVGAKTIDIVSVKYNSNLVVRVSCMDGSGYYVDKTIPIHKTEEQPLIITTPILSSEQDTQTSQIATNKSNAKFVKSWFISDMMFNEVAQPTGVINAYIVRVDESGLLTYKTYLSDRIPGSTMVSIQQMIDNTTATSPINSFVEGYTYCGAIGLNEECTALSVTYATLQATITAYTTTLTSTAIYDKSDYVS